MSRTRLLFVVLVTGLLVCRSAAEPVPLDTAAEAGITFLQLQIRVESVRSTAAGIRPAVIASAVARAQTLQDAGGRVLGYVLDLAPTGYVVLSADTDIAPVIAYSFDWPFPWPENSQNALLHLVRWDLANRIKALPATADAVKQANRKRPLRDDHAHLFAADR